MPGPPVPTFPTVVPGAYETAAGYNVLSAAAQFLANVPLFVGYQSAAQSIPNATLTAIGMDTTGTDLYGGHSNVTNNSRYTPNVAGWFMVVASVGLAANSAANRFAIVYKNGAGVNLGTAGSFTPTNANSSGNQSIAFVQCNGTTDYLEVIAFQNSGGALNTVPTQSGMQVVWIHA